MGSVKAPPSPCGSPAADQDGHTAFGRPYCKKRVGCLRYHARAACRRRGRRLQPRGRGCRGRRDDRSDAGGDDDLAPTGGGSRPIAYTRSSLVRVFAVAGDSPMAGAIRSAGVSLPPVARTADRARRSRRGRSPPGSYRRAGRRRRVGRSQHPVGNVCAVLAANVCARCVEFELTADGSRPRGHTSCS